MRTTFCKTHACICRRWLYTFDVSSGETLKTRALVWMSFTYKLSYATVVAIVVAVASRVKLRIRNALPVIFAGLQTLQVGGCDDAT